MPRRVRLLCACCLTEGMGIDWRLGRDWFALTLIDHDPAINEMMWQNAGLCGVDPFYVGLRWEEGPDEEAEGGSAGGMAAAAQEATMPSQEWAWTAYVRRWVKDSEMRWPPHLRTAASRPRPSLEQASQAAEARRRALRPTHKLANLVGRTGVRVDVRGAGANAEGSGGSLEWESYPWQSLRNGCVGQRRAAIAWCAGKNTHRAWTCIRPTYFVEGRL